MGAVGEGPGVGGTLTLWPLGGIESGGVPGPLSALTLGLVIGARAAVDETGGGSEGIPVPFLAPVFGPLVEDLSTDLNVDELRGGRATDERGGGRTLGLEEQVSDISPHVLAH